MLANDVTDNIIPDPRTLLVEKLSLACEELFDNYGLKIKFEDSIEGTVKANDETNVIGLLGASADGIRISVAIQTSLGILNATYPAKLEGMEEHKLQDWIGELSNQLLGRFKNKLLPYGCDLTLSVPVVVQGANLKAILPKRTEINAFHYSTAIGDDVYLFLSTLIEEDNFNLHYSDKDSEEESISEGDFIFF